MWAIGFLGVGKLETEFLSKGTNLLNLISTPLFLTP